MMHFFAKKKKTSAAYICSDVSSFIYVHLCKYGLLSKKNRKQASFL